LDVNISRIRGLIQNWLTQYERLLAQKATIEEAKKNYVHYTRKLDKLEEMKKSKEDKGKKLTAKEQQRYDRNVNKHNQSRTTYQTALNEALNVSESSWNDRTALVDTILQNIVELQKTFLIDISIRLNTYDVYEEKNKLVSPHVGAAPKVSIIPPIQSSYQGWSDQAMAMPFDQPNQQQRQQQSNNLEDLFGPIRTGIHAVNPSDNNAWTIDSLFS